MFIENDVLQLVPLNSELLNNLTEDIEKIENQLNCKYKAEPIEGFFKDIIKKQQKIILSDEENYLWHTFWLIIRKSDRVVVGSADFKAVPDDKGQVEIGYGLESEFEHNGYMTMTVEMMANWALAKKEVTCIIAETEKDNEPSKNVLKRCGFKLFDEKDTLWWKLTK